MDNKEIESENEQEEEVSEQYDENDPNIFFDPNEIDEASNEDDDDEDNGEDG